MVLLLGLGSASCTVNLYSADQASTYQQGPRPPRPPGTRPPYQTGGVRPPQPQPPTGATAGGVKTPPASWETGGIRQPVRQNPVGVKPPVRGGETGGVPTPPTSGETGGVKTPPNNWQTGGIKTPPASGNPVGVKPPVEAGTNGAGTAPNNWQTGGIKSPLPTGTSPVGVKPPVEAETGGTSTPPTGTETGSTQNPAWETGGIKSPLVGMESNSGKEAAENEGSGPLVTFTKTRCMGICPDFTATIWADGRVTYTGNQNVAKIGTHELHLPAATVSEFVREAQKIQFTSFRSHYASGATDLPSTILTIRQADGSSKTVQAEDDAPAALQELFAHINEELNKLVGNPMDAAR